MYKIEIFPTAIKNEWSMFGASLELEIDIKSKWKSECISFEEVLFVAVFSKKILFHKKFKWDFLLFFYFLFIFSLLNYVFKRHFRFFPEKLIFAFSNSSRVKKDNFLSYDYF